MEIPTPTELKCKEETRHSLSLEVHDAFVRDTVERLQTEIVKAMMNGSRTDNLTATNRSDCSTFKKRFKLAGWIACEPDIERALVARFRDAGWRIEITWHNCEDAGDQMIFFRYTLRELTK